ncbi:MAG: FAD-dependent oxidoreductase [Burkholderiales bacterium]|nr:FAD-dependent oxidoreductase [Burkholderiales bacterium]
MKRRDFLAASSLALIGCTPKAGRPLPPGELLGPNASLGHRFRDGQPFPAAKETRRVDTLIIGGGMAGLSCAWWLKRHGHIDFALLEMEAETGGNARSGQNAVSAYPWGAHYVPIPGPHAMEFRALLAELGVLRGDPTLLRPEYDERYLCFAPQERLYLNGNWQEGLLPQHGVDATERAQQRRFLAMMGEIKARRDARNRPAFNIPSMRAQTPDVQLDHLTMHDWLRQHGFDAPSLHWWVNYGLRDDFGTDYRQVSAWAGLHYYSCRHGEASNAEPDAVLTWPAGNGWLAGHLARIAGEQIIRNSMVWRISTEAEGAQVDVFNALTGETARYQARRVIWAGQTTFLAHAWHDMPTSWRHAIGKQDHAPWLVANLTLHEPPQEHSRVPLCWDNVLYNQPGLGYVVATHQRLDTQRRDTVFTYYRPLTEWSPAEARKRLLTTSRENWAAQILAELGTAHPDIAALTARLDVWRWGHAMVRPVVGMLDGRLDALRQPAGPIMIAHSDLSGMSLAEEAHYWGVRAARWVLNQDWNTA